MKRFICTYSDFLDRMGYEIGGMGMEVSLDKLPVGVPAVVTAIRCSPSFCSRLRDFGLVSGTRVMVRYRSPDRGVAAVEFRGTVIAMRCKDLKGVRVRWQKSR
ncbi:MAG: ferrous iron transport protein A [Ruminococcaceae bacterium]|nr:ferrous iron transport protein A [Oscillospiraceae bacterium]